MLKMNSVYRFPRKYRLDKFEAPFYFKVICLKKKIAVEHTTPSFSEA